MELFFVFIDGEQKGDSHLIRHGLSLGRRKADLILRDSKVSSEHAQVVYRDDEKCFYLIDLGSANGIRINGKKASEIKLVPNLLVQLGRTFLQVQAFAPQPIAEVTWQTLLLSAAKTAAQESSTQKQPLFPFNPPILLNFVQGIQHQQSWLLGYGPREIGPASLDLIVNEDSAPPICFTLTPGANGPLYKTDYPKIVKLNGREVSSETLSDGDIVEIRDSRIKIKIGPNDPNSEDLVS